VLDRVPDDGVAVHGGGSQAAQGRSQAG